MIIGGLTSTVSTVRPAFKWVASIGAVTYRLSVVDAGTGIPVPGLDGVPVKTTSYIAPTALNQNVIEVATDANFTNIRATKAVSNLTPSFITISLPNGP